MVVRFLPSAVERAAPHRDERENLAEVIEFRTRLRRPEPEPAAEFAAGEGAAEPRASESSDAEVCASEKDAYEPAFGEESSEDSEPVDGGRTAQQSAVKLLARKPLSSGELHRALMQLGHAEFDADEAVAECEASLYLDDEDLARSVTRKLRESKGESRSRIRQKLRERHLPDAAIEVALEELDEDDELELLRQTAVERAKRMAGLDQQVAERRLLGYLARRGWSGEKATKAVRDALSGNPSGARRGRGAGAGARGGQGGGAGNGVRFS